ncbi:hypothetical protein PINS_up019345 [Pythium insidiosum]|nr:hypothetical protein PINS_up019345 [Pythium insidiosum]
MTPPGNSRRRCHGRRPERLCYNGTAQMVRGLTATSITLALLSLFVAIYLHLGSPTQRVIVWLGAVPSIALLITGAIGTAVITVWQRDFGALDNGDTYTRRKSRPPSSRTFVASP